MRIGCLIKVSSLLNFIKYRCSMIFMLSNCLFLVALQTYLLVNCQYMSGGLIDKPGKLVDSMFCCFFSDLDDDGGKLPTIACQESEAFLCTNCSSVPVFLGILFVYFAPNK